MSRKGSLFSLAPKVLHAVYSTYIAADCDQGHGMACLSVSLWSFCNPLCVFRKGKGLGLEPGHSASYRIEVGWGHQADTSPHLFLFRGAGAGTAGRAEVCAGPAEPH